MHRPRWNRTRGCLAAAALTLAVAACGGPAAGPTTASAPGAPTALTVGVSGQLSNADVYVGIRRKVFADAGLVITPQVITAGSNAIPQLLSGQMQFATVDVATAINATKQNVGITAVAPNTVGSPADTGYGGIVASAGSGVTALAGLAGKKVQVNQLNGTAQILTTAALAKAGVDPASVQWVEIAPPQAVSALQSGRVDAAVLSEPNIAVARGLGMVYLANPEKNTIGTNPTFVFVAATSYVRQNPGVVATFQAAVLRSNALANSNPAEVREVATTSTQIKPELLQAVTLPTFGEQPLTAEQIRAYLTMLQEFGGLDPASAPAPDAVITSATG
jgi:NitT/TauT family transport system substrate-binding protein